MADQINVKVILDPSQTQAGSDEVVNAVQGAANDIVTALNKVTTSSNSTGAAIRSGFAGVESQLRGMQAQIQAVASTVQQSSGQMSGALSQVPAAAGRAGQAMTKLGHQTAATRREFIVIGHEILTGQWTRVPGSLMVLGERMDWLAALASPFGASLAVMLGGLAAVGLASIKGAVQMEQLNNSLILTGNRAGLTGDQYVEMASRIAAANEHITSLKAEGAVSEVAATGVFGPNSIQAVSTVVAEIQRLSGETAKKVAEDFAKMDEGVTKWAETNKLAKNLVSGADLEYVRSLEEQGKKEEAEIYLADRIHEKLSGTAADLGYLPGLWNAVAQAASHAWDEMMGWGRKVDPSVALQQQLEKLKEMKNGGHYGTFGEAGALENGRDLDAEIAEVQGKLDAIHKKAAADAKTAADNSAQKEGAKALDETSVRYNKAAAKAKELTDAQNNLNKALQGLPDAAHRSAEQTAYAAKMQKEYEETVAGINARGKKPGTGGAAAMGRAEDNGEMALIKDRLAYEQKLLETSYKAGEIKLKDYYDARINLVRQGLEAELAVAKNGVKVAEQDATHAKDANSQQMYQAKIITAKNRVALINQQLLEQESLLKSEMEEQSTLQERKLADLKAQQANAQNANATAQTQRIAQLEVSLGQMTNQQLISLEQQLEDQRYQIALQGLQSRLALAGQSVELQQQLNGQIEQLEAQHQAKMTELNVQAIEEQTKDQRQAMNDFASDLDNLTSNIVTKPQEWRQAFGQFFTQLNGQLVHIAADAVWKQLIGPGTSAGGQISSVFGKLFNGATGGVQATQQIGSANIATATIPMMSVGTMTVASSVGGGGGSGGGLADLLGGVIGGGGDFAGAFGFTSSVAGSTDAVIGGLSGAAADTGATGMSALMGLAAFAQGSPYIPKTQLALVHQGEAIIPAAQNSPYANGNSGVTVNNQFVLPNQVDLRTQGQVAAMAGGAIQSALKRNG